MKNMGDHYLANRRLRVKIFTVTSLALVAVPIIACYEKYCSLVSVPDLPSEGGFSYDVQSSLPVQAISSTLSGRVSSERGAEIYGIY